METQVEISVDKVIKSIQDLFQNTYGIRISPEKIKGVAFAALKESGHLSKEDKYKTYDHVTNMLRMFNDAFGEVVDYQDMEHFTGNLFYGMRVSISKSCTKVRQLMDVYSKSETLDSKQVVADLFLLQEDLNHDIKLTWRYLENTQVLGASMIITKLLKSQLNQVVKEQVQIRELIMKLSEPKLDLVVEEQKSTIQK